MRTLTYEEYLEIVKYNDNEKHLTEKEYYKMIEESKMD